MDASIAAGPWMHRAPRLARAGTARDGRPRLAAFALHEWLLSRPTLALARALERSQWWPAARLAAQQLARLRRLIAHARAHCPYYGTAGLPEPDSLRTLDDLAAAPLLSREDIRRDAAAMCWTDMPGRLLVDHSSGTSGAPLRYYWDRRRQAWDKAQRIRGHGWYGFPPIGGELHLWPLDPPRGLHGRMRQWTRACRDRVLDDRQIDCLSIDALGADAAWRTWRRVNPRRVTAYPSALCALLAGSARGDEGSSASRLERVFLTGEVTFDWQRAAIGHSLGAPTTQVYGVQEAGAVAYECPAGAWHVCAESCLVEFVRDGRAARPGELAEVVVTGLVSEAMPMIRYRTGDVVRVADGPLGRGFPGNDDGRTAVGGDGCAARCSCGRGLPVMPAVLGRSGDFLEAADGAWIEPARVFELLSGIIDPGTVQVRQDAAGEIRLSVSGTPLDGSDGPARAAEALARRTGRAVAVDAGTTGPDRSQFFKCRYIRSERTDRGLA